METICVPLADTPSYAVPSATSKYTPLNFQDPCFLDHEIYKLWQTHQQFADDMKADKSKLTEVGASLGELLFAMKSLLASECGRGGKWSRYLREHGIARATADRYVNKFAIANGLSTKSLSEAISEPTEAQIGKLLTVVHERCERVLGSPWSRFAFIKLLANRLGLTCTFDKDAFIIRDPEADVEEAVAPEQQVNHDPAREDGGVF